MAIWQMIALFAMAGCAIGCLLGICIAVLKLAKGVAVVTAELGKLNAKCESIEVVNRDDSTTPADQVAVDPLFADLESAISNFEKLKRMGAADR